MLDPTSIDPRHPRVSMRGPRPILPQIGATDPVPELPYWSPTADRRARWMALGATAAVVVLVIAVGVIVATHHRVRPQDTTMVGAGVRREVPTRVLGTSVDAPGSGSGGATTTPTTARRSTPPPAPPTTSTATATTAPKPAVPVGALAPHEAVYRNGKLILQGTLPNKAVAERFRREAAAVIGADNVIVRYRYDPRVAVPTDGRVRVDERFVFDLGSARVDPAYFTVFDLGVTVLKLNPQATMGIRGYTDDAGSRETNLRLSRARAQAAADYLVGHGIDPSRIVVTGFGPDDPVVPNDSAPHRAENRRIEVDLFNLLG